MTFLRTNARWLGAGMLLTCLSSFGQTFFISIFGGEIRAQYDLSNGEWGLIYMIGTTASAAVMVFAGGLADRLRVRQLGITVVLLLGMSCVLMALNPIAALLPFVIFLLRFFGQGMTSHVATVSMARWFVATRGRALAIAATIAASTADNTRFLWLLDQICFSFVVTSSMLFAVENVCAEPEVMAVFPATWGVSSDMNYTGIFIISSNEVTTLLRTCIKALKDKLAFWLATIAPTRSSLFPVSTAVIF